MINDHVEICFQYRIIAGNNLIIHKPEDQEQIAVSRKFMKTVTEKRDCADILYVKKGNEREVNSMGKSGDSNQITRDYFDSILLKMSHIDSKLPSTEISLFGEHFTTPIMTAALSHLGSTREDGMVEMAKGACRAGALHWCGMGEKEELGAITATGAKTVKIIKPYADNRVIFDRIEHAVKCGVLAVGMDIDHAFNANGEYGTVMGLSMKSKSAEELKEFVQAAGVPFIIKGVLSERDAEKCLDIGAGGIVVSHHHGIMDFAVPPLQILPDILHIVDGKIPVFVDCCVESGMDAFKALALGATAVCAGRVLMDPLKQRGADGVEIALVEMTERLRGVMARTGYDSLKAMDDRCIFRR